MKIVEGIGRLLGLLILIFITALFGFMSYITIVLHASLFRIVLFTVLAILSVISIILYVYLNFDYSDMN